MRAIPNFTKKEMERTKGAIKGEVAKIYRDTNGKIELALPKRKTLKN